MNGQGPMRDEYSIGSRTMQRNSWNFFCGAGNWPPGQNLPVTMARPGRSFYVSVVDNAAYPRILHSNERPRASRKALPGFNSRSNR